MASASNKKKEDETFASATKPSACTMLDLNDDCLLKICEYLDLAELSSFADVCGKFKQNAQLHFGLKKLGDITEQDWRGFTNRAQFSLLRNFGSSISSLTIPGPRVKGDFLVEMMVRYCGASLNSMSLLNVHLNQQSVKKLQPLLSRLQKVDVRGCDFVCSLFDMLSSCAPELRELKLDRGLDGSRDKFKQFPKLGTFSIDYFVDEDFEGFLGKNQQLKIIEVGSGGHRHFFDIIARCVPSIVLKSSTNLRNTNFLRNLAAAQVPIEFLELRLGDNLMDSISELRQMKTLRLLKIFYNEQSLLEMCNNLGELTELYLLSERTARWSADLVLKIVQNAKKLQKLYAFVPVNFPQKSIIDVDMYTKILHVVNGRNENMYLKIILLDKLHSIDVPRDLAYANKHMLSIEIDKVAKENADFYEDFDDHPYDYALDVDDLGRDGWFGDSD